MSGAGDDHAAIAVGLLFDLRNPSQGARDWHELYAWHLDAIEHADRRGIASVLFSEHHFFDDGYLPAPLTLAAAAAARTTRVRVGTAVLLAALRNPLALAEEAAVVDVLSGGRLDLGIGAGYRVPEFEAFGVDIARRFELVERSAHELRRLWAERVTPRPLQDPVPIWGGFYGPRGVRMAGRLGMGLLAADRELLDVYRAGLAEGGHDPSEARLRPVLDLVLADDPEAAWPQLRACLQHKWDGYRRYMIEGTGRPVPPPIDPDRWRAPGPAGEPPRFQVLTPADAAAFVRETYAGLPVVEVVLWGVLPGMPRALAERHLELAATELSQLLNGAPAASAARATNGGER